MLTYRLNLKSHLDQDVGQLADALRQHIWHKRVHACSASTVSVDQNNRWCAVLSSCERKAVRQRTNPAAPASKQHISQHTKASAWLALEHSTTPMHEAGKECTTVAIRLLGALQSLSVVSHTCRALANEHRALDGDRWLHRAGVEYAQRNGRRVR